MTTVNHCAIRLDGHALRRSIYLRENAADFDVSLSHYGSAHKEVQLQFLNGKDAVFFHNCSFLPVVVVGLVT
jgi:hypothetical protein